MRPLLILVSLLLAASAALAQSPVSVTVTEPSFTQTLWANVQGPLTALLSAVLIAAASWLAVKVNTFFNVTNAAQQKQNEVIIRNILHDAAWSAVKYASQKTGVTIEELQAPGMPPQKFINAAVDYIHSKNPDASKGITAENLEEIVVSKVPDLIAQQQQAPLPVVVPVVAAAVDKPA